MASFAGSAPATWSAPARRSSWATPTICTSAPARAWSQEMGGLHRFTTWPAPMLTDSGGFQVFSLEGLRRIGEDGVEFQSHVDGTYPHADARARDGDPVGPRRRHRDGVRPRRARPGAARRSPARGWSGRCGGWIGARRGMTSSRTAGPSGLQSLWPIVQGGTHDDLRRRSLDGTLERGPWTGIAIGGTLGRRAEAGDASRARVPRPALPRETPRYLMGVGFPADLLEGIARGVDLFDCVAATRNGRHGTAWLPTGRVNVRGAGAQGIDASRSIPSATARPAPPIRAATCGISSWSRTCSGSGWSRCTTSASWSGWASRRAPTSWPGRSTAGAASGSAATTLAET